MIANFSTKNTLIISEPNQFNNCYNNASLTASFVIFIVLCGLVMVWKSSKFKTSVPRFLIAKYESKYICRMEQRQKGNYEIPKGENEANIKKKNTMKLFRAPVNIWNTKFQYG